MGLSRLVVSTAEQIYCLPGHRIQLNCTSEEAATEVMANGLSFRGFTVELTAARFERTVRIHCLPYELNVVHVRQALLAYGNVISLAREFQEYFTGVMVCKMQINQLIPSKLVIKGQSAVITYKGQVRTCFTCGSSSHENRVSLTRLARYPSVAPPPQPPTVTIVDPDNIANVPMSHHSAQTLNAVVMEGCAQPPPAVSADITDTTATVSNATTSTIGTTSTNETVTATTVSTGTTGTTNTAEITNATESTCTITATTPINTATSTGRSLPTTNPTVMNSTTDPLVASGSHPLFS